MEEVPFSKKVKREAYNALIGSYRSRLFALQQEARSLGISCVIVAEGATGAVRKKLVSRIMTSLDPQSTSAYADSAAGRKDRRYPVLRRYWLRLPARGAVAVFDRGWYRDPGDGLLSGTGEELRSLERQAGEGGVVIKLLLHMPRKKLNKACKEDGKKPITKKQYRKMLRTQDRLQAESAAGIPWTVLAAGNLRSAEVFAYEAIIAGLGSVVTRVKAGAPVREPGDGVTEDPVAEMPLDRMEPGIHLKRKTYGKHIKKSRARLRRLIEKIKDKGISLAVLAEAADRDKAERCIRFLARAFIPESTHVVDDESFNAADDLYPGIRRYYRLLPPDGRTALYVRSWYTQAMGGSDTCGVIGCARADITALERQITSHGGVLVKLWLQEPSRNTVPAPEGQEAENTAHVANCPACEETLLRTDTAWAPWTIIDASDWRYTRAAALDAVLAAAAAGVRQKRR